MAQDGLIQASSKTKASFSYIKEKVHSSRSLNTMRFGNLILLLTLSCFASAKIYWYQFYGEDSYQTFGCVNYLYRGATFCEDFLKYDLRLCFCKNLNAIASMVGCWDSMGKKNEKAMEYYVTYCKRGNVTITVDQIKDAYQYYLENAKTADEIEGFNKTKLLDTPLKVNETLAKIYYDSEWVYLGNYDRSLYYGAGSVAYWGLVFFIAMVANWSLKIFPSLRTTFNGPVSKAWRKYITLPALMKRKKSDHQKCLGLFDFLIPTRMESIVVFVFFWFEFGVSAAQIRRVNNDPIFKDKMVAIVRYLGDKTGIVGTVLLPLLFLLSGRNNFLQWLTMWNYSTFIMYHRWIARIVVLLIVLHSIFYTVYFVFYGTYASSMKLNYLVWGTVGTICGGLLCFHSLLLFRRKAYEWFLVLHILLAVFFMVGTWYHLVDLGYLEFMFATIAVWGFDRVARLVRIFIFGFPEAEISLVEGETLRIVVPKPKYWKAIPGGHVWLHVCCGWSFWQAHPFTFFQSTTDSSKIVFLCKIKKGITKTVADELLLLPGRTISHRVCVDGPYGEPCPVSKHSSAIFLAGGNGIPGMFSEVYDLAKRSADNSKQMLKLIWVIREAKSVAWMFEELEALRNTKVQTTIYITKPEPIASQELQAMISGSPSDTSSSLDQDEKSKDSEKKEHVFEQVDVVEQLRDRFPYINFKVGRPSIDDIVQLEIEESNHSAAFVSCGHPVMVDDLRAAVVANIDRTEKRIDFFEQLQVWA